MSNEQTNAEVSCDGCGHTERQGDYGPTAQQQAAHEATAGSPESSWGDSHIMWPTGR